MVTQRFPGLSGNQIPFVGDEENKKSHTKNIKYWVPVLGGKKICVVICVGGGVGATATDVQKTASLQKNAEV